MADLARILRGLAHDPARTSDRIPFGAVPAGEDVVLTLRVDCSIRKSVHGAYVELFDGSGHLYDSEMDACAEGFRASIDTSGEPRVLFYRFRADTDAGEALIARRADESITAGSVVMHGPGAVQPCAFLPFQLSVYDPAFTAPRWFQGSVMYQIFPDRFARGSSGVLAQGVESHEHRGWPVQLHADWDEEPAWGESYDPVDFFGGTLEGIREKLDYLASFGVEVLYLNPIWEARSNHRYNTGDYECVDPILGTWEAFDALVAEADKHGIKIVLDGVFSHTGSSSRYFNADGSYDSFGAAQGEDSPYRQWYDFTSGQAHANDVGYRCWWGDRTLPEVNERDASWQRFMLGDGACGESGLGADGGKGVIGKWMSHGACGIRLDVADEIPDDVLELIRKAVKSASPEGVIIGEVWEDPTTKESYGSLRTYALGRALDSVMNYPLRFKLLEFALGSSDAQHLTTFLKMQRVNYPPPLYMSLMNLLSSHDVERIRSVLDLQMEFRGEGRSAQHRLVSEISAEADFRGANLQRLLASIVYALCGVPCLYYGDERGMQGGRDPFDRATYPWFGQRSDCGQDLTDFYRALGLLRKKSDVLRFGDAAFYACGRDVVCVLRTLSKNSPLKGVRAEGAAAHDEGKGGTLLLVVNRAYDPRNVVVDLVDLSSGLADEDALFVRCSDAHPRCVFDSEAYGFVSDVASTCEDGIFTCTIEPMRALMFQLSGSLGKTLERGVGVLCHITSLPSNNPDSEPSSSGTLGASAMRFIDALTEAGAKYWQILPLNPTDKHGSPYAGLSAFAGNTDLLDAASASAADDADEAAYEAFMAANGDWLVPYATYCAIKDVEGKAPWREWPEEYRTWRPGLEDHPLLASRVEAECRAQFRFDKQWQALRAYANKRGVRIIGDMPLYMSADSADAWQHPEYFELDDEGNIAVQGGVPPDQFAEHGQLWGVPTYRWDALKDDGYAWWVRRLRRMLSLYDYVRIDHFIGFSSYYAVPKGVDAASGTWRPGPALDFFEAAYAALGPLPVIAEDLGLVTPDVKRLLAQTGFPGMDVVQFADGDPRFDWRPSRHNVSYAGTHDTSTLLGWVERRYPHECSKADDAARSIAEGLLDMLGRCASDVVISPLQDLAGLGDEARMNKPGTIGGNWKWQASQKDVDRAAERLMRIAQMHAHC